MSACLTLPHPSVPPAAVDRPGGAPDRRSARLWTKTVKQSAAAEILAGRYGDDRQQQRAAAVASAARRARLAYTDAPVRESLDELMSWAALGRRLIVELHLSAGHLDSVPTAQCPVHAETEAVVAV